MHKIARIDVEKLKLGHKQVKMRPLDRYLELFKIHLAEFEVNELVHSQIIQEYSVMNDNSWFMKTKGTILVFRGNPIAIIMEVGKEHVEGHFTSEDEAYAFREYLLQAYINSDRKLNAKILDDDKKEKKTKGRFMSFFEK